MDITLPTDSPKALGLVGSNPGELRFELFALARLEVVRPSLGLMKNAFVDHLPLEASHSLFQTLSRK